MTEATNAREKIQLLARESYVKILAHLSARTRDLSASEDALADAFRSALEEWPENGVPSNPEGWLFTVAKNRILNQLKHKKIVDGSAETTLHLQQEISEDQFQRKFEQFEDDRLKMLFVCAHPSIDEADRTPLMLQVVMGLDVDSIASAFLVSPSAMSKRLVRAKQKIRVAGIPFEVPETKEFASRLEDVLNAIYAIYGSAWNQAFDFDAQSEDFVREAELLVGLIIKSLPFEPEPKALLALIHYCEARKAARCGANGRFTPFEQQDTNLWSKNLIQAAEDLLSEASKGQALGRFQLEAAIQSAHCARKLNGDDNWSAILVLYQGIMERFPSIGANVNYCVALAKVRGAVAGLNCLDLIQLDEVKFYQPYWVARADLLAALGRLDEARSALDLAIGMSLNSAARQYLMEKLKEMGE